MNTTPTRRRRRNVRSLRRRDGLIRFAGNVTSQNGEDGIIARIFELLGTVPRRWCVDVGAWDGKHLSNTYSLLLPNEVRTPSQPWTGVLIEAHRERFRELLLRHQPLGNICINAVVSGLSESSNSLNSLLLTHATDLPADFDFLSVDVDGCDYWVLLDLLQAGNYHPKVICIEFNPSMPIDLVYIPPRNDNIRHGASLSALVELADRYSYVLAETTTFNAFFIRRCIFEDHFRGEVPDPSIESLHEVTMGTSLFQLYDGTLCLWGCRKLLWHRLPIDEDHIQVLPPNERIFPFAEADYGNGAFQADAVDISAYRKNFAIDNASPEVQQERNLCSHKLLEQLKAEGFCFIRGTSLSSDLCRAALRATNSFLQEADESVRRSCLSQDRARRGYSPMCTENFASLLGEKGPNDLVRKFRVGPVTRSDSASTSSSNSLLHPNIWPTTEHWTFEAAAHFRSTIERYYEEACNVAEAVVLALCDGLLNEHPELGSSLEPFLVSRNSGKSAMSSSILTLLGYRVGSRHKRKNKGPLVAAHTDVGVITLLLFDSGDCASLQRQRGDQWVDVKLPGVIPDDPVFVVNVADCLSELSGGRLPSTLHRVVATSGAQPRNALALFVGLSPDQKLRLEGNETLTFEEWRKLRIARAQSVRKVQRV